MRNYVVPVVELGFPGSRPSKEFPEGKPIRYAMIDHKWGLPGHAKAFGNLEGTIGFIGGGAETIAPGLEETRMECLLRELSEEIPGETKIRDALLTKEPLLVLEDDKHTFTFVFIDDIKTEKEAREYYHFTSLAGEGYIGWISLAQLQRTGMAGWMIQTPELFEAFCKVLKQE